MSNGQLWGFPHNGKPVAVLNKFSCEKSWQSEPIKDAFNKFFISGPSKSVEYALRNVLVVGKDPSIVRN